MSKKLLYAGIQWGFMVNGNILESQLIVTDSLEDAIKHCEQNVDPNNNVYIEEFYEGEDNRKVVWGTYRVLG